MIFRSIKRVAILVLPVLVIAGCNKLSPQACLEASNLNPALGEEVTFINCSKRFKKFELTTGDGGLIDGENAVLKHSYETPGSYQATLTVTDKKERNFDEITTSVNVRMPQLSEMLGGWDLQRIETWSYFGDDFARGYGDYTLESTQNVEDLRYSFQADTFFLYQLPDSTKLINGDWSFDYLPDFPDLEVHFGFGPGLSFNVISLDLNNMVGRTRNNDGLYDLYFFERAVDE